MAKRKQAYIVSMKFYCEYVAHYVEVSVSDIWSYAEDDPRRISGDAAIEFQYDCVCGRSHTVNLGFDKWRMT